MDVRRIAWIACVVLGILLVVGGAATWALVTTTLRDQQIVTPDDACLPGRTVSGPFTAYCQAQVIEEHTLEATGGLTYAELEQDDPRREVAMDSSFLQASLFTSILAYGVSAMAIGMGLLFILLGLGIRDVRERMVTREPVPA